MVKKYRSMGAEVLYSQDAITMVSRPDIEYFKRLSSKNSRKRIRLCTHDDIDDRLHEMFIIHEKDIYVRPHKHIGKTESTHIIEGQVDVVIFDDYGHVERVICMGDYTSGKIFYYRMAIPVFHTLIIRSKFLVFHETTNGPFNRSETVFATWSPEDGDMDSVSKFTKDLHEKIKLIK